jgi:hypothetical protein
LPRPLRICDGTPEGDGLPILRNRARWAVTGEESIALEIEIILKAKGLLLLLASGENRMLFSAPALRAFVEEMGTPFFTT